MRKHFIFSSAIVLLATIGSTFAQTHAYIWDATNGPRDLGTLGTESFAYAVNDSGTVVGTYIPLDKPYYHGFIWTEATGMVDLGIPGGGDSEIASCVPTAINSAGNVVGYARQVDGRQVAFFWSPADGFTAFGHISTPCDNCNGAFAINNLNQVTGNLLIRDQHLTYHAFLWSPSMGRPRDLGAIESPGGSAGYAINNLAQIVGGGSSASIWSPIAWSKGAGMRLLGTIDGSVFAQAQAINDAGQIVGLDQTGTRDLAWYTAPGTGLKFLKGLGGNAASANAINQQGVIVGYSEDTVGVAHGVMWPTPSSTPLVLPLQNCYDINNFGQVVGWAAATP